MLESLHISNYALIDRVDITFHPGLNIITGETGAGKSIMLGALSLLLGARADARSVTHADTKSVIEAIFTIDEYPALRDSLEGLDVDWDDRRCILRRELAPNGRSRAFINDTPVPLARLRELSLQLVDIHNQHNNQLLADPAYQLRVIDTLASNRELLAEFGRRFDTLRHELRALKTARAQIARSRDDEDFLRYQLEQLDDLDLQPGELRQLMQDREVAANATELKTQLHTALQALSDGPASVTSLLDEASGAVGELDSVLDESDDIAARLEAVAAEINDIAATLYDADSHITASPGELEAIDARIDAINTMLRRHKVQTEEQLMEIHRSLSKRLDALDNADTTIADLERRTRRALALARETAAEISERRHKAAEEFAATLTEKAKPLGMNNLRCEVKIEHTDISATGTDSLEFLFAFNKNQTPLPVGNAASGGEISRLMLCIKAMIADKMSLPSIIFDEVDTGVSGDVANRIGRLMDSIGRSMQVIAITHLPQVAARGAHHYKVRKEDDELSTHTRVAELDAEERLAEIALMLSGNPDDPAARATAASMLQQQS